jgi:chaperone modulatory protein CbpM
MISEAELVASVDRIELTVLRRWVDLGWIVPEEREEGLAFDEQDVARVELICDLVFDIAIDEESMPVVLSLIDQLHETRRVLKAMASAIEKQPEEVRRQIEAEISAQRPKARETA